jgi:hypothetical protein
VFKLVSSPMCLSQQDSRSTLDRPLLSPRNRRGVRPCGGCEAVGNTTTLPPRQFEIGEVVPRWLLSRQSKLKKILLFVSSQTIVTERQKKNFASIRTHRPMWRWREWVPLGNKLAEDRS